MKWFRVRFFVGVLSGSIYATRLPWPPLSADWEGSVGPFFVRSEAERISREVK